MSSAQTYLYDFEKSAKLFLLKVERKLQRILIFAPRRKVHSGIIMRTIVALILATFSPNAKLALEFSQGSGSSA